MNPWLWCLDTSVGVAGGGGRLLRAWASGMKVKFKISDKPDALVCVHPKWERWYPSGHPLLGREHQAPRSSWCLDTSRERGREHQVRWSPWCLDILRTSVAAFGTPLLGRGHQAHIVRSDRWLNWLLWCLDTPREGRGALWAAPSPGGAPSIPVDLVFRHLEEGGSSLGDASSPGVGTKPTDWPGV